LNVPLPPDLEGEWIGTDDFSQYNASHRGFVDGQEHLTAFNKLHETPTGSTTGDVKFMVRPKWMAEKEREINVLQAAYRAGISPREDEVTERYRTYAESIGLPHLAGETSSTRFISGDEINALTKR
jgi:hypothetical protein